MKERHICFWSGKRGGFGALTPTLQLLSETPGIKLSIVVTDQHLWEKFGKTEKEVRAMFPVTAMVDMEQKGDSNADRARAIGVCLTKAADVLAEMAPDILLILGDRGEVFAAAIAAHNLRIAIAHVQGGDISGTLDEPVRHSVTKLAHIHFPSTQASAARILAMGEEPWRVHTVGDPHIDQLFKRAKPSEVELRERYKLGDEKFLIVLQHSDSTAASESSRQMNETLSAVEASGMNALLIYPCSDQGFQGIINEIEKRRGNPRFRIHQNIPAADFAGLLSIATALVGNSSAGLIEAPYFSLPSVNVGDRQIGREHTTNVLHVPYDRSAISAAIKKATSDSAFRESLRNLTPPFGDGKSYERIAQILREVSLDEKLLNKRMTY
jgi:UDP-N-acetylglucosamine 2-epimerase (non-hydrolysing)/GDP/UDP-N,N'-diacetylbacillosamine 2-epimerase (hydrolysing)